MNYTEEQVREIVEALIEGEALFVCDRYEGGRVGEPFVKFDRARASRILSRSKPSEPASDEAAEEALRAAYFHAARIYEYPGCSPSERDEAEAAIDRALAAYIEFRASLVLSKPLPVVGEPRNEVRWFAGLMEETLRANDHKGGWQSMTAANVIKRMREETDELDAALMRLTEAKVSGVRGLVAAQAAHLIQEACDVANFAMMLADNTARRNDIEFAPRPPRSPDVKPGDER